MTAIPPRSTPSARARSTISAPRSASISRKPVKRRRRRLDLFRRPAALRRRRQRGQGGDARLRAEARCRRARAPLLVDLRRQDHHLPPARRGSAGAASTGACPGKPPAKAGPRRHRCRAAISRSTGCALDGESATRPIRSSRPATRPAGARLWHARRRCARRRSRHGISGCRFGATLTEAEVALSRRPRMGANCRGRRLAPLQAWPALTAAQVGRARRLDGGAAASGRGDPQLERAGDMSRHARHVTKSVGGKVHIRDVSLTLEPGTINILLGPTLSGKTVDHAAARRARSRRPPAAFWSTVATSPASRAQSGRSRWSTSSSSIIPR